MIILCNHLREAGVIRHNCCLHCHIYAGCCGQDLPDGHKAIFCCARIEEFSAEEIAVILAKVPEWEQRTSQPMETTLSANSTIPLIPEHFRSVYMAIQSLEQHEQYIAALIYGSVVEGDATKYSTLFAEVIVKDDGTKDSRRPDRNDLVIHNVMLHIVFLNEGQFLRILQDELYERNDPLRENIHSRNDPYPLRLSKSFVVFDKKGAFRSMQKKAQEQPMPKDSARRKQNLQVRLLHKYQSVNNLLAHQPDIALLKMDSELIDIIETHYRMQQKWWVGIHHTLSDLQIWDTKMAQLVKQFLATSELQTKFRLWSLMIYHILKRSGYRSLPLKSSLCTCKKCAEHIQLLQATMPQ